MFTLADKLNLKNPNKNMTLVNLSIYYICPHVTTINLKSPLQLGMINLICLNRSETVSDIQDYFKYTIKKHSR